MVIGYSKDAGVVDGGIQLPLLAFVFEFGVVIEAIREVGRLQILEWIIGILDKLFFQLLLA